MRYYKTGDIPLMNVCPLRPLTDLKLQFINWSLGKGAIFKKLMSDSLPNCGIGKALSRYAQGGIPLLGFGPKKNGFTVDNIF
jgi:hypothetical protein